MHHMLAKFEPNRIIQNVHNVELFDKEPSAENHFWQNVDALIQDVISIATTIIL